MPKPLRTDLHIHSNFSDGSLSISEIVDLYGRRNFDVIAITDHLAENKNIIGRVTHRMNVSLTEETFKNYLAEVRIQKARALKEYNLNVIFGFEITKNYFANNRSCHVLILGVEEYINPELSIEEIMIWARKKGGLIIAAHPFPTGDFEFQTFYLWDRREKYKNLIDAWEMSYRKKVSSDVMKSGLPMIATSDFHNPKHLQSWKTMMFCENNFESVKECVRTQNLDFYFYENPTNTELTKA